MPTPVKRQPRSGTNEMAQQTPPLSFSHELRQVLQERNLLTAKNRAKVCSMLGESVSPKSVSSEFDKRKSHRLQAIQEILSSEQTYLNQLELLMQFFIRPLKEYNILDDASHTALFGQIEMIHNLNGEFLRELEKNVENVAQAFVKMAPFFKLYSVYAFDYKNSVLKLQDLTNKNQAFRKFLEQTESRPEVQRKLNSLMIVPIQRVPRYKLLLEQVLLYTSPLSADYKLLKESVKQIESTVSHINSCVQNQECTQVLINLQNSLVNRMPNVVKPSRKVVKEGVLQKVTHKGDEVQRYCVLMSDIFVYCKILKERLPNTIVENSLECCCIFPLKKCKVHELFPGTFKVTCQGDGIILSTNDLQLGRVWVCFLREAIDLHIQCRKTLRKESSKKIPMRKKHVKDFDLDYVISPNKKKYDFDTVFRNKNNSTDLENYSDDDSTYGCFSRKKPVPGALMQSVQTTTKITRKRLAPPPPPPLAKLQSSFLKSGSQNGSLSPGNIPDKRCRIAKLKEFFDTDFKLNATEDHAVTHGTAFHPSDTRSNFRVPDDGLNGGNFRDVLFPLRSSNGSSKSQKSGSIEWEMTSTYVRENNNEGVGQPPQKKRVKFDETQNTSYTNYERQQVAFTFPKQIPGNSRTSLREMVYEFFTKLFK